MAELHKSRDSQRDQDIQDLEDLIGKLEELSDDKSGIMGSGITPPYGWGIAKRIQWAKVIAEVTVEGERARTLWREAVASISDPDSCPAYGGLEIAPQIGLLPLGRDPASGLWEFVHVLSGPAPERRTDGSLSISAETGVVLVLLPPGSFLMGAQSVDSSAPNYDPVAGLNEGPVRQVTLPAFFLSKFELTLGQWQRLTGETPNQFFDFPDGLLHPVESVSWTRCSQVLGWFGLGLPTQEQWEFGARAGSSWPWYTGPTEADCAFAGNVADRSAREHPEGSRLPISDWDDGYPLHSPVAQFEPNEFGLFDVLGNVWEWCQDDSFEHAGKGPRRGRSGEAGGAPRAYRGGCFNASAWLARLSLTATLPAASQLNDLGVRPARALDL